MNNRASPASCKLCASTDLRQIRSINTQDITSIWKNDLSLEISPLFNGIQSVELMQCHRCALKFFVPDSYPRAGSIYSHLQKFDWYYMPFKWEYAMALEDMKGFRKILEIGCGTGHFLERARAGLGLEVSGTELNENAVLEAQRKGLSTYCMDIQEAASRWVNHFDAICAFQVLEHVENPRDFLLQASAMIRPGGKLLLGIPNGAGFLKYQFDILDMPPHHLTRWDSRVMSYLPNLFPFSIQHIKEEPLARYHVHYFLNAYRQLPFIRRVCSSRMKDFLALLMIRSGLHTLLKGHTLYASFVKH